MNPSLDPPRKTKGMSTKSISSTSYAPRSTSVNHPSIEQSGFFQGVENQEQKGDPDNNTLTTIDTTTNLTEAHSAEYGIQSQSSYIDSYSTEFYNKQHYNPEGKYTHYEYLREYQDFSDNLNDDKISGDAQLESNESSSWYNCHQEVYQEYDGEFTNQYYPQNQLYHQDQNQDMIQQEKYMPKEEKSEVTVEISPKEIYSIEVYPRESLPQEQEPYPQESNSQEPYPQESYSQEPYSQDPYPQESYSQEPYPQESYSQEPYSQENYEYNDFNESNDYYGNNYDNSNESYYAAPDSSIAITETPPYIPNVIENNTETDIVIPGGVQMKKKHLQVWERFFVNAAAMKESASGGDDSVPSSPKVIKVMADTKRIDFTASLARNYFTFATAAEQFWPVLISQRRYYSLTALAKASIGLQDSIVLLLALFAAVINDDKQTVEGLLMTGANLNCIDEKGRSAAHHAARSGNQEMLALLYDASCDLDVADFNGWTPLHIAVLFNRPNAVRFLLECAVDKEKETQDEDCFTAGRLALRNRYVECCYLLGETLPVEDSSNRKSFESFDESKINRPESPKSVKEKLKPKGRIGKSTSFALDVKDNDKSSGSGSGNSRDIQKPSSSASGVSSLAASVSGHHKTHSALETAIPNTAPPLVLVRPAEVEHLLESAVHRSNHSDNNSNGSYNYNKPIARNSEDDYSDEADNEGNDDAAPTVLDNVASFIWGAAVNMIGLTINLLTNKASSQRQGEQLDNQDESAESDFSRAWSRSDAPPTDQELFRHGLAAPITPPTPTIPTPRSVALSTSYQEEDPSARPPLVPPSPLRVPPPPDVQVAIALAKSSFGRQGSSTEGVDSTMATSPPGNNVGNTYSLGQIPPGVSWRYVNILDDSQKHLLKKK